MQYRIVSELGEIRMLREAKYGICSGGGGLAPAMVCCEPDP
jgi:hypothetical protein